MHSDAGFEIDSGRSPDTLIVCIGNGFAGDDAVGQVVFERLRTKSLPASCLSLLIGLGGVALLDHFCSQRLMIVIDAVQLGCNPGFLHVLTSDQIPAAAKQAISLHGIGLQETLSIARELYPERVPRRVVLIGIEGRRFNELGAPLSAEVAAAVDSAVNEVMRQIEASA